jgi:acyl-coenzyme A thioesterase PaaI-like protein
MRPAAPGASVVASAHCYKVTRTIAFLRAEAWDASREDLVATAQAAFTLNRREAS